MAPKSGIVLPKSSTGEPFWLHFFQCYVFYAGHFSISRGKQDEFNSSVAVSLLATSTSYPSLKKKHHTGLEDSLIPNRGQRPHLNLLLAPSHIQNGCHIPLLVDHSRGIWDHIHLVIVASDWVGMYVMG